MILIEISGREFALTSHAVRRYRERVRPSWSFDEAGVDLVRRLRSSVIYLALPAWARERGMEWDGAAADEFIGLGEELLLPVERGVIKTVLAPGRVGAAVRFVRWRRAA